MRDSTPPLVGRERVLERINAALARSAAGSGELLWLLGPGGIGKSRLAGAATTIARERGFATLQATAREFERHRPFAVLIECLRVNDGPEDRRRAQVRNLLGAAAEAGVDGLPRLSELALGVGEALHALVEEQCARAPTLIVLDDLQWADESSLHFVGRLAKRAPDLPLLILCAARPLPRHEQLERLLALCGEGGASRVELEPLTTEASTALAAFSLGTRPGSNLCELLRSCGGNPLFIGLMIEALRAEGMLATDSQERVETVAEAIPASLDATVLARLSALGADALEVLGLASVLGRSFSVAELSELSGRSTASLWPALRDAISARVLIEERERLAFGHDLVREALYRDMPASVRAGLHLEHGRALAARGGDPALVAEHLLRGAQKGDREAVSWLERAAREAAPRGPGGAAELLTAALELSAPGDPARGRLMAALGLNLVAAGRREAGEEVCRAALAENVYPPGEGRLRLTLARSLLERGEPAAAMSEAVCAARSPTVSEADRAEAMCWAVAAPLLAHDLDAAAAAAADALRAGERASAPGPIAVALVRLGHVAAFRGDFAEQLRLSERALAVAEQAHSSEVHHASHAHLNHAFALADWDLPAAGIEAVASGRRAYERLGMEETLRNSHHYAGYPYLLAGAWDEALTEAQTALALSRESNLGWTVDVLAVQALILVRRGERQAAGALLSQALAALGAGAPEFRMGWVAWAQALLQEADGARAPALEQLWGAWREVSEAGVLGEQRTFAPDLARMLAARCLEGDGVRTGAGDGRADGGLSGERDADRARLQELAEAITRLSQRNPGLRSLEALALRCQGLARRDATLLERACERHDPAARPHDLALAHEDAAVLLAAEGERERAGAHAEAALAIHARLGTDADAARLAGRLRAAGLRLGARGSRRREISGWGSLTPSELRVAELAAAGLSNPQIAERLVVSRHTVATHISHILTKLELRSRFELAGARPEPAPASLPLDRARRL